MVWWERKTVSGKELQNDIERDDYTDQLTIMHFKTFVQRTWYKDSMSGPQNSWPHARDGQTWSTTYVRLECGRVPFWTQWCVHNYSERLRGWSQIWGNMKRSFCDSHPNPQDLRAKTTCTVPRTLTNRSSTGRLASSNQSRPKPPSPYADTELWHLKAGYFLHNCLLQ